MVRLLRLGHVESLQRIPVESVSLPCHRLPLAVVSAYHFHRKHEGVRADLVGHVDAIVHNLPVGAAAESRLAAQPRVSNSD
jgi:hypothetical protein